mmetsp:Transcript_27705/g.41934  ORF Transcript_27705/g.41934 Transcript_27705/m.41934 type:complete len:416 (-) Transcript_27705:1329-2576(-)
MLLARTNNRSLIANTSSSRICRHVLSPIWRTKNVGPPSQSLFRVSFSSSIKPVEKISRWNRVARAVRYTRIPFLVLSVYGLGYQQGIMDDIRDPKRTREAILEQVLISVDVQSRDNVYSINDDEITSSPLNSFRPRMQDVNRIATIGRSVIRVARDYVKNQLEERARLIRAKLPNNMPEQQCAIILDNDSEVQKWRKATMQLNGSWSYILLDTHIQNAFVSEILPKRIFVTTAMLKEIYNDDELALVLGHEVSHLVLGHVSKENAFDKILITLEVLLLSLDPTEGFLSLAFLSGLATIRQGLKAARSRENEREADELGIKFAAMACYDTEKAATVFRRMHQDEEWAVRVASRFLRFADTHPPSIERFEDLVEASRTENAASYPTHCVSVRRKMMTLQNLFGSTSSDKSTTYQRHS